MDSGETKDIETGKAPRVYWCFISYRHADNKRLGRQWASWLHQAIEEYEVPPDLVGRKNDRGDLIPERIFPVFRDEAELPADAELSKPIELAIRNSRFLLVLCSPRAVESRFVSDEILLFKKVHPRNRDRVLAAIIAGDPAGGDDVEETPYDRRQCFPRPLRFVVDRDGNITNEATEPIAPDFRLEDGTEGFTTPAAYREILENEGRHSRAEIRRLTEGYGGRLEQMKLKIISGILGLSYGELSQRDKLFQLTNARRKARTLRRWLAMVATLGLAAVFLGVMALRQRSEALFQAQIAKQQRDQALIGESKVQAVRAVQLIDDGHVADGIRLALDSLPSPENKSSRPYTTSAEAALRKGLSVMREKMIVESGSENLKHVELSPSGEFLLTLSDWGEVKLWNLKLGEFVRRLAERKSSTDESAGMAQYCSFNPAGDRILIASRDGRTRIFDLEGKMDLSLAGHSGPIHHASFSPDGTLLATASGDRDVRLWKIPEGSPESVLSGQQKGVSHIAFSKSGKLLASASSDGTACLWDPQSGKLLHRIEAGEPLGAVVFSPDELLLLTLTDPRTNNLGPTISEEPKEKLAALWRTDTGALHAELKGHTEIISQATFSPDGKSLLTVSQDGTARIWNPENGKSQGSYGDLPNEAYSSLHGINAGLFLGNEGSFVTAHRDHRLILWKTGKRVPERIISSDLGFSGNLSMARNGTFASCGANGTARIWNVSSRDDMAVIPGISTNWAWLVEGQSILMSDSAGESGDQPGSFSISGKTGADETLRLKPAGVLSPDGTIIASVSPGEVTLRRMSDDQPIASLGGHTARISDAVFRPDGRWIATFCGRAASTFGFGLRSNDHTVRVWDTDGTLVKVLDGHRGNVEKVAFSPDGRSMATASWDGMLRLWRIPDWTLLHEIPTGTVLDLKYSPDGKLLAAGGENGALALWSVADGKEIAKLSAGKSAIENVRFRNDGKQLITASMDGAARIWNVHPPTLHIELKGDTNSINQATFSRDGRYAVTAMVDPAKYVGDGAFGTFMNERTAERSVLVWDAMTGELIQDLGHDEPVTSLQVCGDGRRIVTTSSGMLRIWNLPGDVWEAIQESKAAITKVIRE